MNTESSKIISELEKISNDVQKTFGNLAPAQINWKPGAEGWSVAQCFDHLIKTNALFYNELDQIAAGTRQSSFLEKYSPLSFVWSGLLINSLKKDSRKFKVPTQKIAPPSEIDPKIVEKFTAHQAELIEKIKPTETADWNKIKITSPFLKVATYTLLNGFQIIVEHEKRHFRQAERVTKSENFPR